MSEQLRAQLHRLTAGLPHRDLTTGTLRRHQRRRRQHRAVAAVAALAVAAAGTWAATDLGLGSTEPDVAVYPTVDPDPVPVPTTEPPPEIDFAGSLYYLRVGGDDREQLHRWTIGEPEPQLVAEVGDPEDRAFGHDASRTLAISPDGDRVSWVTRHGTLRVVDVEAGELIGGAVRVDSGCFPPVWHPDSTELLIHYGEDESGWLDVESGEGRAAGIDLSDACAATVFRTDGGTLAVAFEDRADHALRAVTEDGEQLWRIEVASLVERLNPEEELWRLVGVADGGGHACVNVQRDVAADAGGGRQLSGNLVVETGSGRVVADGRPRDDHCAVMLADGFVTRIDDGAGGVAIDERHRQLRVTSFDGGHEVLVDEPVQLYLSELVGFAPMPVD